MKILFINTYYYPYIIGGAEISTQKLAENLARNGNEVTVLTTHTKDEIENINGVNVIRISVKNVYQPIEGKDKNKYCKYLYRIIDLYNIFNYMKVNKIIRKLQPDIIHSNNVYGISPIIFKIAKVNKIKTILTFRDYYFMCPRFNLINKKGEQCKEPNWICKAYREFNKKALKNIDFFTAPSQYTLSKFIEAGFFDEKVSKKVFNAIDFSIENVKRTCEDKKKVILYKKKLKFVYMSRLEISKGIKVLIENFLSINNDRIELHIAGDGSLKNYVEEITKKDHRIFYHGFLGENHKNQLLMESDVMVIPSLYEEPFGRVVIDAYMHAMPVIGSKKGGIQEIIIHNETGLLIDIEDQDELRKAIIEMSDNRKIYKLIDHCCEYIKEFSIDKQTDEFMKIYRGENNRNERG